MSKADDLSGKRFGRYVVIQRSPNKNSKKTLWTCRCDCGSIKDVDAYSLKSGVTKSCGCLQKEVVSSIRKKHGMSRSRIYRTYKHMIERCSNKNNSKWLLYGGKGISVCKSWLGENGFENFLSWSIANGYDEKNDTRQNRF